jgi:hypothetical protein
MAYVENMDKTRKEVDSKDLNINASKNALYMYTEEG